MYGFSAEPKNPANAIRCNIFVAHRGCAAGSTVPAINGTGITSFYPPLANQWAGIQNCNPYVQRLLGIVSYGIYQWSLASSVNPQPGFVIAHPDPANAGWGGLQAGHCAIIDYDGKGIGAGVSGDVNKRYDNFYDGTALT